MKPKQSVWCFLILNTRPPPGCRDWRTAGGRGTATPIPSNPWRCGNDPCTTHSAARCSRNLDDRSHSGFRPNRHIAVSFLHPKAWTIPVGAAALLIAWGPAKPLLPAPMPNAWPTRGTDLAPTLHHLLRKNQRAWVGHFRLGRPRSEDILGRSSWWANPSKIWRTIPCSCSRQPSFRFRSPPWPAPQEARWGHRRVTNYARRRSQGSLVKTLEVARQDRDRGRQASHSRID